MLMAIGRHPILTNRKFISDLPPNWGILYRLTTLSDDELRSKIADRTIHSDMKEADCRRIVRLEKLPPVPEGGCIIQDLEVAFSSGKRYGVIYADPPWEFKVYSGRGKDRSADSHYVTRDLEWIKGLPVQQLAADDCALFLWAVMPELPGALEVIKAWGFEYKTVGFTWVKQNSVDNPSLFWGMGYWTRANAELCLLATRGSPKRQARDVHQIVMSPVGEHSRKPEEVSARIERLVPGPYLELFARRPMKGWDVCGDQITRGLFHQEIPEVA